MKKILFLMSFVFFCIQTSNASTQAKFSLVALTPTSIVVPENLETFVAYRVTNNTAVTRTLTINPIPGVEQVTTDNSFCSSPFQLAQGQSCILVLKAVGSQLNNDYSGGPVVCKTQRNSNTPDPFLCSQPEQSMVMSITQAPEVSTSSSRLYVSNWDGASISLCYIQSGALNNCHVTAVSGTFKNPEALAVSGNYLFVANITGGISSCLINAQTGGLSYCGNAIVNAPIYAPDGIAIQSGFAYIANSGPELIHQGVTVCNVSGGTLSNCTFTQGDASFATPSDLAILGSTLYITNYLNNQLPTTWCTVANPLCTTSSGEGTINQTSTLLNQPEGLYFANNYAYFTNYGNNTIVFCSVASPTVFSNCSVTGGYFEGRGNLVIDNNSSKAFVPSGKTTIGICSVENNGSLSNCINSAENHFNGPSGLLIN